MYITHRSTTQYSDSDVLYRVYHISSGYTACEWFRPSVIFRLISSMSVDLFSLLYVLIMYFRCSCLHETLPYDSSSLTL